MLRAGTPERGVAANRLGKMSQRAQFLRIFCANATAGRHSCFRAWGAVRDARHGEKGRAERAALPVPDTAIG